MANPHDVLGVDRDAGEETVKHAYRELVKKHHPDQGGDAEKFHEIRTAYEQITSGTQSQNEETRHESRSITCSDCGVTVARKDIKVIRGERYCDDCYVETSCEQCGEPVVDTKQKFQELGESVICSNCTVETHCANCHRSVRVNPRKQNINDELYCSDCTVEAECNRCGKDFTTATDGYQNGAPGRVCEECEGQTEIRLPSSPYSRRAAIAVFGVLAVGGGAKAFQEGYFTGTIGAPEPDFEETEDISITDESYYAERFNVPGGARLEYELDVVSGSMTSRLYTSTEYDKFKQGFDERNRYDEGEHLDSCTVRSHSGSGEFGCGLPGEDRYALVLTRASNDATKGMLSYRIFI